MTSRELLAHLIARTHLDGGTPLGDVGPDSLDALIELQASGSVIVTQDPPMVWVHPDAMPPVRERVSYRRTYVESDLPPDVDTLKHAPDRDSMPVSGMRLNGEPVYRPRDEPSSLVAMGSTPWPPDGTSINCRKYREHRAQYTEVAIWDLHVVADACPVCGKPDGRKPGATSNNVNCVVCDLWARDVRKCVRTFEPEPDCQPEAESKPKRKNGAKAG